MICGCQNRNRVTKIEIPVPIDDTIHRSIEENICITGNVYPEAETDLKSKISGTYYIEKNPRTMKPWQLGDNVINGDLIIRLENREFTNSIEVDAKELSLELIQNELINEESQIEKGGITPEMLKTADINRLKAKVAVENARIQLEKNQDYSPNRWSNS